MFGWLKPKTVVIERFIPVIREVHHHHYDDTILAHVANARIAELLNHSNEQLETIRGQKRIIRELRDRLKEKPNG